MDGPSLKNLRMIKALCGTNTLRNVVLATTMWEKVAEEEGLRRETELKQSFWKDMIECGSTVTRITKKNGSEAYTLVKSLLKNRPMSTQLQEELHSGKSLHQTGAGTEIKEGLERLEQKLREEHIAEIAELQRAQIYRELLSCHFIELGHNTK
jgi:protein-arginine kinase activator protein McsA